MDLVMCPFESSFSVMINTELQYEMHWYKCRQINIVSLLLITHLKSKMAPIVTVKHIIDIPQPM